MSNFSSWLFAAPVVFVLAGTATNVQAQTMCTSANQQNCYRFLCNGMDANGNIENVCSNGCSTQNAPRWASPTIPVRVDRSTVPASLGVAAWNTVVDGTLDAWEAVSSSNMVLQDIGNADFRRTNDSQSEIFWITSTSEWQQKIGSGVYGALGVTIPLYYCGNPGEITTADLVMNGAGFTNWKATQSQCTGSGCTSARATLLHELGHWVGLDHPCQACAWSAMSASAYTEPDYPLAVDAAAVSSLYPGSPGGLGYGCSTNAQCNSPYTCTLVDDVRYCTQTCSGSCPEGFVCDDVAGTDTCIYDAGPLARPAGLDEPCPAGICEDGLLCLISPGDTVGQCYQDCTAQASACGADATCLDLGNFSACFSTDGDLGDPCGTGEILCRSGLVCVGTSGTDAECRNACTPQTGSGCFADESCFELTDGSGACFTRGNAQEGGSCDDNLDCANDGLVCLIDGANNSAHCYQRCDEGFQCRFTTQTCRTLQALSYCDPLPGAGGGDTGGGGGGGGGIEPGDELEEDECRPSRGHYDCPNGFECKDDGDGDDFGLCQAGQTGDTGTWGLCDDDSDCIGGLCHNGVCTRPCDFECADGYSCDIEAIPGGLCKADSCRDDESICGGDFSCVYSSKQRYVCAKGVAEEGFCSCASVPPGDAEGGEPTLALALLGVLGGALTRRRRH